MTGTGTQSDPYIPTTLTEFITAVGTAGAYVALTQDINAADDPAYTGELTSIVGIYATSVEGNQHEVRGVTVRSSSMLYIKKTGATVKNIYFRDWGHKRTVNGATIAGVENSTAEAFEGCTFSIVAYALSGYQKISHWIKFKDCGIEATIVNAGVSSQILTEGTVLDHTTLVAHGIGASSVNKIATLIRSAMIFDTEASNVKAFETLTAQYSYFAFLKNTGGTLRFGAFEMSTVGCVLAVAEGQATSYVPSGTTVGTLAQLKDKDWLTSVGFLP